MIEVFLTLVNITQPVKITTMTDKIYEFWYNDCIHESAAACISLHRTKKGAEMGISQRAETQRT